MTNGITMFVSLVFTSVFLLCVTDAAIREHDRQSLAALIQRISALEARDRHRHQEMTEMKLAWEKDRQRLECEIERLKLDQARKDITNEETEHADIFKSRVTRQYVNEHTIAFFATVTPHDVINLSANQPIKFDNTVVNIGHAYQPTSGMFLAPVNGTYSFSATIYGRNPNGYMYFALEKNNKIEAGFEIKINQQVSQTVILNLHQGDQVCVKSTSSGHDLVGSTFTTFSGFLLFELYDAPVVVG